MLQRVISISTRSKIYHKRGCPYIQKIKPDEKRTVDIDDPRYRGYRACKYCGGVRGWARIFYKRPDRYDKEKRVKRCWFDKKTGYIFLKTAIGFWKAYFRQKDQKWLLFHLNYYDHSVSDKVLQNRKFHRQGDFRPTFEFDSLVNYIVSHDKNKEIAEKDYRKLPQKTKKQKKIFKYYKKKKRRDYNRRMDKLFESIKTRK